MWHLNTANSINILNASLHVLSLCDTKSHPFLLPSRTYLSSDCHRGQSLVVHAINEGRQAAREVDLDLMGYTSLPGPGGVVIPATMSPSKNGVRPVKMVEAVAWYVDRRYVVFFNVQLFIKAASLPYICCQLPGSLSWQNLQIVFCFY